MRDLEISPRSRNCAFDACSGSHFSYLSYLSPSYSPLPYRIFVPFVHLLSHSRPYGFVPILSSILCTRLSFILQTSSNLARTHRTQNGYKMGRWVEGQKLEKRSCKTQRGRRERHGCIAVRHNAHRLYLLQLLFTFYLLPRSNVRSRCRSSVKPAPRRGKYLYVANTERPWYTCIGAAPAPFHTYTRVAHAIQHFELSKTELYRLDCIAARPP